MTTVRQSLRRSVLSLWQTEAQRASTAPAKILCWEGGSTDALRAGSRSRTRPHSQIGKKNAVGEVVSSSVRASAGERGGGELCGVGRGDNVSGSTYDGSGSDRPSGTLTDSGYGAEEVPECGSAEEIVDRTSGARAMPTPLRSSHRVGPVGALGERRCCSAYRYLVS